MWPSANCLYEQLFNMLQAKKAVEKPELLYVRPNKNSTKPWTANVRIDRSFILCGKINCAVQNYVLNAVVPRVETAMMKLTPSLMIQHINRHPCLDLIKETLQLHNHSIA